MTGSNPTTLDEYIKLQRVHEFDKAQRVANAWNFWTVDGGTIVSSAIYSNGGVRWEKKDVSRPDRNKYDVHKTFDNVFETINASIENIAHDLTSPGVEGISALGLKSIQSVFDQLVNVRNEFLSREYDFATAKPEPVPEVIPDSDGIIHDKYGNVVGRVATGSQE